MDKQLIGKQITRQELIWFLGSIERYFKSQVDLVAIGGTALTLLGLKNSTKDIDFNLPTEKDFEILEETFYKIGFEKQNEFQWLTDVGLRVDITKGRYIFSVDLEEDYFKQAKKIGELKHLRIYTLSPTDIVITKLARSASRDLEDIRTIFVSGIDHVYLVKRYIKTMEHSAVFKPKQRLEELFNICLPEWEIETSQAASKLLEGWEDESKRDEPKSEQRP